MQNLLWRTSLFVKIGLLFSLLSFPLLAKTIETPWLVNPDHPPVDIQFALTGDVEQDSNSVLGLLHVRLADDWKTYWRSPGEGGIAPTLSWKDSSHNIQAVDWFWPFPEQFNILGIRTLGYQKEVVFPLHVRVEDLNQPVQLKSVLTLPTCTTICVLTDYPIDLEFEPQALMFSEERMFQFSQAMSKVPPQASDTEVVSAIWDQMDQRLAVTLRQVNSWSMPTILPFVEAMELEELDFQLVSSQVQSETLTLLYDVFSWTGEVDLQGQVVNLNIKDNHRLFDIGFSPSAGIVEEANIPVSSVSTLTVFGWALIGGLILNIMPCVLPVLGMKLNTIVSAQGVGKQTIRKQFLATSAGIVACFWLIAVSLSLLKFAGHSIGWGMQFQSVWFLALMALVTGLFAFNMLGLLTVSLPNRIANWAGSKGDNSYAGHFVQGMFATLLATPCSAPFLATAIAYAFGADMLTLFAIFTALALGMSLPWLAIALYPKAVRWLPKPGKWMLWFKLALGTMMLLTSIWLLTLLRHHIPLFWVVTIGLFMFVWMLRQIKRNYGDKSMVVFGSLGIVLSAGGIFVASMTTDSWVTPLPPEPQWVALSQDSIDELVGEGKTVFVDVSADWCITCKSNKIGVLLQQPVYGELHADDTVPMLGDWTRAQSTVTEYLRANNRFGVPFNIVYGPGAPEGIPLPVILNDQTVLDALNKARGEKR
ncbi:cytochrome C biogenesis protein [Vibrio astriarenae]|uniref:Cytochrome C biogenesis protein n=1 Tax=Vibrio astriarenae TaxID=1481923 RepID=A0A7Z2T2C5_9VIBR|nr:protein-disulfide reductase DsbD domain-containing protein [Vibrio astriarenae]QIA62947.1 cytochrome C biogenesis protein [Vibrio astriarenae]